MVLVSESGFHEHLAFPAEPLDCLVVLQHLPEELVVLRRRCPHLVGTSNRSPVSGFAMVINDDVRIGRMGAEHLLGLGYRTLAFITPPGLHFAEEREAGFVEAVTRAGLPAHLFKAGNNPDTADAVREILTLPGPTAVMAASDLHARRILDVLEDPLALVPDRLAVLGVDNDSLQNTLSPVPLSSVAISGERIGYEAAAIGMRMAAGEPVPAEPVRIAPRHVISRRSTDALVIKDRIVARALRLMRENMGELRDAADIVRLTGIPRRTLEVKFRKLTGQTLAGELARARIQRARGLLSANDLSVKEIAYLVGFSEPRMLSIVFKRVAGELPTEYRARARPGG
jgi:LacI family transcriptional regulator